MDSAAWISCELLPSLVAEGILSSDGAATTILSCKVTPQEETGDHFASSVYFVKLQLNAGGDVNELNLVVKMEPADEYHRTMMNTKTLFANEAVMYTHIFPRFHEYIKSSSRRISFTLDDLFPVCYKVHADSTGKGGSYLVLVNLKADEFSLSKEIFLDYEKCVAALQQLGRFHGLSYAYKKHNPRDFFSVIVQLTDPRQEDKNAEHFQIMKATALRGIEYIKSQGAEGFTKNFLLKIEKQVDDIAALMRDLVRPTESLAVLCHGDFCRNNLFFRTSVDRTIPCDMKMFDLQLARYSSPAIDTAFFAYMSLSAELRKGHWDSLFQYYHTAVVTTLSQALEVTIADLGPEYSLQCFKEDFASHALYGYLLCSFFLPVMMLKEPINMEQFSSQPPEVTRQFMAALGGDSGTEIVGGILKEVIDINMTWGSVVDVKRGEVTSSS